MSGINTVVIGGRITKDPEMRYFESGKVVAEVTLAIDAGKDKEAHFVQVKAWGKTAELIGEHFHKGDFCSVTGRIEQERWESDGQKRSKLLVVADKINWCPKRSGSSGDNETPNSDEVPF